MNQRTKIYGLVALLLLSVTLSACGQRKPLQTPDEAVTDSASY